MWKIFTYSIQALAGIVLLLGLPLLGVKCFHVGDISYYLQFPPRTDSVEHIPFNPYVFWGLTAFILVALLPFFYRAISVLPHTGKIKSENKALFPWWGYLAVAIGAFAWFLAWTRFSWTLSLRLSAFPLLWVAYILFVNALSYRRKGGCLLLDKPLYLGVLFPVSALFWWFFEYLNRFVQNWYYVNTEMFSTPEYIFYATICFSTVLPAVLSSGELLQTFSIFPRAFGRMFRISPVNPRFLAFASLLLAGAGLFFIGVYPNYLFPLLWICPLIVIVSLLTLWEDVHLLSSLAQGDWSRIMSMALAALLCGFFWEMWNFYSLYKWEYSIPFVHRYQLFEMPVLGYAGYLPFGLECAVIGDLILKFLNRRTRARLSGKH